MIEAVIPRSGRALAAALATASLLAAAPAPAQTLDHGKPDFDSRSRQPVRPAAPDTPAAIAARARLDAQLGRHGVLDVDARTGTPRTVARLDGFLTGPSDADPAAVVLGYVRAQREVFGLSEEDLGALRLVRRYTDRDGVTHLLWAQTWRGIIAWDNELRASVAADGRLVRVGGSPLPGLSSRSADPELSASQALSAALGDAGRRGLAPRATARGGADRRTTFTGGHSARLMLFAERRGDVHLAWNVVDDAGPGEVYEHLIDARSGEVLLRQNSVDAIAGRVNAFEYAPGKDVQSLRDVPVDSDADLLGPNAYAYVDMDGNGQSDGGGTIPASTGTDWTDSFVNHCTLPDICSWGPGVDSNDVRQGASQAYYFSNRFHDWLRDEVGFDTASGNFEGADPVRAEVVSGFSLGERNNAFMSTPPDGQSPRMAMFMWGSPNRNGADDATVVYHEYTHGLTNRLITRPNGFGALDHAQSGAMGEGWSDWYAMDYLVEAGLETDTATAGEIAVGAYSTGLATGVRRANLDCPVGFDGANCASSEDTYGDFEGDSVHDDGEIWAQTLWDLRTAVGGGPARRMITQAMRLSPDDPSFIDMRNAILQADQVLNGGANRDAIWGVFRARGMGFTAFSSGGDDRTPVESFVAAPPPGGGITIGGRVTDRDTGSPVAGALVEIPGVPGVASATTDASGAYSIAGLAAGTYPELVVSAPGREIVTRSIAVSPTSRTFDQPLRRNLAAASGGATIAAFTGPDFTTDGCGPGDLIDGSRREGWGSTSGGERSVTVRLPAPAAIEAVRIDPGAVCGDDDSASTGPFRVETSADGTTFTQAASGAFDSDDNHRLNEVPVNRSDVRLVRLVAIAPQGGGFSAQQFMDAAELEVIGAAPAPPPAPKPDPGPGPAPPPPPPDLTAPLARLGLLPRQRVRTALRRGLKLSLSCDEPCSGSFTATVGARVAKRTKLLGPRSRRRSVRVATGRIALGAGRRTVRLRFGAKAKRRLRRQRSLRLGIAATIADAPGNSRRVATTVRLRR